MGRFILTTILLLAFAGAVQAATPASERRTALVIGNADYSLISPLRNPVNDARAMARVLNDLGFEVIAKENLNQKEMKRAIRDFGRKLGQGGVGLFYYSGHGLQIDGVNYLVPVQAPIQFEDDVDIEAVAVNAMLAKMASAANRLNIVILDSCRNNPYERSFRSTSRGLAQMSAPTGTIVAYAAAPGGVALDGDGENGVYTGALLEAMQLPGLKIEEVFKRVRIAVREISEYQQVPWESSSLTGDFYFNLNVSVTVEAPQLTARQENLLWQSIEDSTDPAMYDAYLRQFPDGTFADVARLRSDALRASRESETQTAAIVPPPTPAFAVEEMDTTFVALQISNVRTEPTTQSDRVGRLTRDDAIAVTGKVTDRNWYRIEYEGETAFVFGTLIEPVDPGEIAAWTQIASSSEVAEIEAFLGKFPNGFFAARARSKLSALTPAAPPTEPEPSGLDIAFWESVRDSADSAAYEAYLQQFPNGHFAELAKAQLSADEDARRKEAERLEAERLAVETARRKEAERLAMEATTASQQADSEIETALLTPLGAPINTIKPEDIQKDEGIIKSTILRFYNNNNVQHEVIAGNIGGDQLTLMKVILYFRLLSIEASTAEIRVMYKWGWDSDSSSGPGRSDEGIATIEKTGSSYRVVKFDTAGQTYISSESPTTQSALLSPTKSKTTITEKDLKIDKMFQKTVKDYYDQAGIYKVSMYGDGDGAAGIPQRTHMETINDIKLVETRGDLLTVRIRYTWRIGFQAKTKTERAVVSLTTTGSSYKILKFETGGITY